MLYMWKNKLQADLAASAVYAEGYILEWLFGEMPKFALARCTTPKPVGLKDAN